MGRKKKRRNKPKMKQACRVLLDDLPALRNLALDHMLAVAVNGVQCGRRETLHVMFNDAEGNRVLNWWPGTGRTWAPETNKKGRVADGWAALDEAARLAAEVLTVNG